MTDAERLTWISTADYEQLLRLWRFEPAGSPWFQGEVGTAFARRMQELKSADPAAAVRASKRIGWD